MPGRRSAPAKGASAQRWPGTEEERLSATAESVHQHGRIVAVRGSVVDVQFDGQLPAVGTRLDTGADSTAVLEVVGHLDDRTVRTIALTPTRGLARGEAVIHTGRVFEVSVGPELLGRVLNVLGEPMDDGPPIQSTMRRPTFQAPVPLTHLKATSEILATGIKAIPSGIGRASPAAARSATSE